MNKADAAEQCAGESGHAKPVLRVIEGKHLHVPRNSRFALEDKGSARAINQAAVFLDRDGVIVEDVHYLTNVSRLHLLPGVPQALRVLQQRFYIIVVTNQSGVARGLLTEADLLEIHSKLVQRLCAEGTVIDALYYCPHLPEATLSAYRLECECRKPKPGLLLQAADDWGIDLACSYLVGDTLRDIEAGCRAGVRGILLGSGVVSPPCSHHLAPDLLAAAHLITV